MSITLVLISNVSHALAEFSINKSLETNKFDEVLVASDRQLSISRPHRFVMLPPNFDRINYSCMCIKGLQPYIETEHFVIVQPDGMAIKPEYWDDAFTEYDYIGAPGNIGDPIVNDALVNHFTLPQYKGVNQWYVGNGGFSLRSKKLLKALEDERITEYVKNSRGEYFFGEDYQLSLIHRELLEQEYGIKYAPLEVALRFSTEKLVDNGQSFGFHGWQNIPWFLSEDECIFYIEHLKMNWDEYRLNRLMGFLFEKQYYRAMDKMNELRRLWNGT